MRLSTILTETVESNDDTVDTQNVTQGLTYSGPSVTIGSQTWMSKNLDVDDGGDGIYHHNGETFYSWDAAKRVCSKLNGWHLPFNAEWRKLINFCGGPGVADEMLKSKEFSHGDGRATNDAFYKDPLGFTALPVGHAYGDRFFQWFSCCSFLECYAV